MCPVCGHDVVLQSATHAFVESSCARCGRLLGRVAAHARVGVEA